MKDFLGQVEVFEELIWIVCKKRVKLKPAPVGGGRDSFRTASEDGNRIRR